jgi:hypothetical protein
MSPRTHSVSIQGKCIHLLSMCFNRNVKVLFILKIVALDGTGSLLILSHDRVTVRLVMGFIELLQLVLQVRVMLSLFYTLHESL